MGGYFFGGMNYLQIKISLLNLAVFLDKIIEIKKKTNRLMSKTNTTHTEQEHQKGGEEEGVME
jgi:hypothetical protein